MKLRGLRPTRSRGDQKKFGASAPVDQTGLLGRRTAESVSIAVAKDGGIAVASHDQVAEHAGVHVLTHEPDRAVAHCERGGPGMEAVNLVLITDVDPGRSSLNEVERTIVTIDLPAGGFRRCP